jgi:hypothetical protein
MAGLHARDINLDAIYINTDSLHYHNLLEKKVEAYQVAGSQFIDRDVSFACWRDGFTIVYVKELPQLNVVYSFNRSSRLTQELFRITGTITAARISSNGRYLFLKRLREVENSVPRGETLVLDLTSKNIRTLETGFPFIDFSVAPGGNTLLFENKDGIAEYSPETGSIRVRVKKSEYAGIVSPGAPSIAYLSPNGMKILIVNGSGGSYRSLQIAYGTAMAVPGMTSATELCWLDNNILIYRTGGTGSYSVSRYETTTQKSAILLENSLNTNIQFSLFPKIVSFLKDQVIHVYDVRGNNIINTGIEGEDVVFSPDGNRFISLYLKRLFCTGITAVYKKNIELTKNAKQIIGLYQNILDSRKELANDYSSEYIRRKMEVYGRILK